MRHFLDEKKSLYIFDSLTQNFYKKFMRCGLASFVSTRQATNIVAAFDSECFIMKKSIVAASPRRSRAQFARIGMVHIVGRCENGGTARCGDQRC